MWVYRLFHRGYESQFYLILKELNSDSLLDKMLCYSLTEGLLQQNRFPAGLLEKHTPASDCFHFVVLYQTPLKASLSAAQLNWTGWQLYFFVFLPMGWEIGSRVRSFEMTFNLLQADAPLKPAFWISVRPAGRYFPTEPLLRFHDRECPLQ